MIKPLTYIDVEESIGRTVKDVRVHLDGNRVSILFTDRTWTSISLFLGLPGDESLCFDKPLECPFIPKER